MSELTLQFHNDSPDSQTHFAAIEKQDLLARLQALSSRVLRKGPGSLDPSRNRLIPITMELDETGSAVKKDLLGVFQLSWAAAHHPEWADAIRLELETIRQGILAAHRAPLRFLIWAGMGGSIEDKSMYHAMGLLGASLRFYALDSTDPAKLKFILEDICRRGRTTLASALKRTLVVGMALGMTSYEPVINLERLAALYDKLGIDSRANFLYMTLPGSLLDRFASPRNYRRIELQTDRRNSTAGRHSSPLTRGSLYPLGLAGIDLDSWISSAALSHEDIRTAWRLSSFLHSQIEAGRDKITLMLPKPLSGAGLWTKQEFEESLGKSEDWGIKIVIDEQVHLPFYHPPRNPAQDRAFLLVQQKGVPHTAREKAAALRRAGYPVAVLTLPRSAPWSRYMQCIHYTVFGLAWLRNMNFVTQPGVELYKSIANRIHEEALRNGGIARTAAWQAVAGSPRQSRWRNRVTVHHPGVDSNGRTAPQLYADLIRSAPRVEYGELTFFGDMRYSAPGRALRARLHRAARTLFQSRLHMPADVYEGPAMNHSYHEMIIGHGRCFSTILLSEASTGPTEIPCSPDYHRAQFLATIQALEQRGRSVAAITLKDLEPSTLDALDEFFHQAARCL